MTTRIDCQCGALAGLFFDVVTIERSQDGEHLTEIHVPAGHPARRCLRFVAGLALRDEVLLDMFVWNSTPAPDNGHRCDVSTGGDCVHAAAGGAPS